MNRRKKVADSETMLELATWAGVRWRSFLIVTVNRGGNVYLESCQYITVKQVPFK